MTQAARGSGWAVRREGTGRIERDGGPRLFLGGQVHNSSSSSPAAIAESFAHVRAMHGNTVLAPVSWAQVEPEEGGFDVGLVDAMFAGARRNGLRLVLLWFGAFKNAASTYAPRWVRADRARFPRAVVEGSQRPAFTYPGGTPLPVLSVFSPELREADARAFERLIAHLAEADRDGTVAMIQVENETGLLADSRDRCELAARVWDGPVPDRLLAHLPQAPAGASLAATLWTERGRPTTGAWAEVFGDDARAGEVFMAWAFADYVGDLAARGKRILDIPMYANAWLGPQPGQDEAGQYPSGGPASGVLDVWRVAAPALDLLGPDIYVDDADGAMRTYAASAPPLFVPECRPRAGELVRAIGGYQALGWSAFGIDDGNPDGQVSATLAHLSALEEDILTARAESRLAAVVLEPDTETAEADLGDLRVTARGTLALMQRMLLDAGVTVPAAEVVVPDETAAHAAVASAGETRPFGLLIGESADAIVVVGQGLTLDATADDRPVEVDEVVELLLDGDRLVPGRVLNGDERLRVLPTDRVGAVRIRLLRDA